MFIQFTSPQNNIYASYTLWIVDLAPQYEAVLFNSEFRHVMDFLGDSARELFQYIKEFLKENNIQVHQLEEVSNILEPQEEFEQYIINLIVY